MKLKGPF